MIGNTLEAPGSYIIQTVPKLSESFQISSFSTNDLNTVDQDFESSFLLWFNVKTSGWAFRNHRLRRA